MEQEPNEQEPNEATEIVGGKVETVEGFQAPRGFHTRDRFVSGGYRAPSFASVALGADYSCRTVRHHRAVLVRPFVGGK